MHLNPQKQRLYRSQFLKPQKNQLGSRKRWTFGKKGTKIILPGQKEKKKLPKDLYHTLEQSRQALIFEEMKESFFKLKNNKDTLNEDLSARAPYVERIHIIEPCVRQIYFVRNLHRVPHYSKKMGEIEGFLRKCKSLSVKVYVYVSERSYLKDKFITVLNTNTKEWTPDIDDLYGKIRLKDLQEEHLEKIEDKSRGNFQVCAGFSTQNFTKYSENGISRPKLSKISVEPLIEESMIVISKLCDVLQSQGYISGDIFNSFQRNQEFSNTLNIENKVEGFTVATNDEKNQSLRCHVDPFNCTSDAYNGVFAASLYQGLRRVVSLAYGRKSCSDFLARRSRIYGAGLSKMIEFHKDLEKMKGSLSKDLLAFSGNPCPYHQLIPKHFDSNVSMSCQIYFLYFLNIGNREKAIELISTMLFAKDSLEQFDVFCYWKQNQRNYYESNLAILYIDTLKRVNVDSKCSISENEVFEYQRKIYQILEIVSEEKSLPKIKTILKGVPKCKELLRVLLLAGIIYRKNWIRSGLIWMTDETKHNLCHVGLKTTTHSNQLLKALSASIKKSRGYAENVINSFFSPEQEQYDVIFKGQELYFFKDMTTYSLNADGVEKSAVHPWNSKNLKLSLTRIQPYQDIAGKTVKNNMSLYESIVASDDKLFFIKYTPAYEVRPRWFLVQVDLSQSDTQDNSTTYFCTFFQRHPKDKVFSDNFSRWWPEWRELLWNKSNTSYSYGKSFVCSPHYQTDLNKYGKYSTDIDFKGPSAILTGPFNFERHPDGTGGKFYVPQEAWVSLALRCQALSITPPKLTFH